ncbi:hypothetical protein [Flavobacterium johnsoniae]|uniref:hypothetical protein n=1 Tax=Flavobacterium johnsoniae TaxID=986 RepID=UPI0011ECF75A|nr:hypothetical protein [Flavobacterium johnsoniae]
MKPASNKPGLLFLFDQYYQAVQDRWVRGMNTLTEGRSRSTLLLLLVFFVLSAGIYLIWNIYASFSG